MKKKYLLLFFALTGNIGTIYANVEGALSGVFSVSATRQVRFSQGNLQYNAALGTHQCADGTTQQGTWRFATNQWDYVGDATQGTVFENEIKCNNAFISSNYNGWIDLFGYATSGWNSGATNYKPISTSTDNTVNGYLSQDLSGSYANADWGVYNAISNGGNKPNIWRTLTYLEWRYIFQERVNATNLYSVGTVNSKQGLIILPDGWSLPNELSFTPQASTYITNTYNVAQWTQMSDAGAVFLPAAGWRVDKDFRHTATGGIGQRGCYHTSSYLSEDPSKNYSHFLFFYSDKGPVLGGNVLYCGLSVRLVVNIILYTITTSATNGIVTGGGTYDYGTNHQITATPNECYHFTQWSDGNTDNPRTITVTGDATYTAEFEQIQYTVEALPSDPGQGSTTVTNP